MHSGTDNARRVAITDLGVAAASGVGVDRAWQHVEDGSSCISPVQSFDARAYDVALGAELLDYPRAGHSDDERSIHLLCAAAETLRPDFAELLRRDERVASRTAVVLGTSKGVVLGMAEVHRRASRGEHLSSNDVAAIEAYRPGYGTARLAEKFGATGPRSTLALACASSSMAILHGAEMIRRGLVDHVIAGGFDGFSPFIFAGFDSIGALSKTVCRPFDDRRDGTVLGEGAALVLLESEEAASSRGADPLAEYIGGGCAADGVHLTAPDREGRGLARAIRQALCEARLTPNSVDYINAHGTATRFNDAMECSAFGRVFEEVDRRPPVSSAKSIFGHTLGAAGALDVILCVEAIRRRMLPPTINGGEEPEMSGWDFIPGRARPATNLDCVLTTNSGFAGNNTALLLRRWETDPYREQRASAPVPESQISASSALHYEGAGDCLGGEPPG